MEMCEYSRLRDEMLRDRLVIRIRDVTLSKRLNPNLMLEKAKKAVRQKEAMKEQHLQLP